MTLTRVGKLSCKILFLFLVLGAGIILGLENVSAVAPTGIVINEVMANPAGSDTNKEWLELYNHGLSDVSLKDWNIKFFNDPASATPTKTIILSTESIVSGQYLVIPNNTTTAITNAKGKIILSSSDGSYENEVSWLKDMGDGYSMEIIGPPSDPDYQEWLKSVDLGGSPGLENSISKIPTEPTLLTPTDQFILTDNSEILFSWQDDPGLTYEFQLSKKADLSLPDIIESDLNVNSFNVEDLNWGSYYWQVKVTNGVNESKSDIFSFTLKEPVYSNNIQINEIIGDPAGSEATGEWIELFNNSKISVNLGGWIISDLTGTTKKYVIPDGTTVKAWGYITIYRSKSGITLNNDGDGVTLYHPNSKLLSQAKYSNGGDEGWSWARAPDGKWAWTTTPTKNVKNIITMAKIEEAVVDAPVVINAVPIEISTGDYQSYENKLVVIVGKVTSTSGSTFYLDDGSGEVKVYIQSKTGIDKPEIHTGDIFKILGVVDIYGSVWRILPRTKDDIVLVEKKVTVTAKAKSSAKKATAIVSTARAAPDVKSAVTKNISNAPTDDDNQAKTPFWVQLIESIVGVAIILLVWLIYAESRRPKEKVVGGHFGDDET